MTSYRDVGGFLLLGAVWGASFPAAKAALAEVPPVLLAALRFDATGVLVLAYAVAVHGTTVVRPRGRDWLGVTVGATFVVAAHHALLFAGQARVSSAVAAVVLSAIPVLSAGFSRALLPDERLDAVGALGLLVGLAGVGIVANPDPDRLTAASLLGVGLVLASAAAWALGAVLIHRTRTDLPVEAMQGWTMVLGAPLLHVASVLAGEAGPASVEWTDRTLLAFVYLVPVAGVVGYLLYFALLDRLGPIELNLVEYAIPVFAAVVGWAWLGERVTATTVLGFGVILAGFVVVKRRALRAAARRAWDGSGR